MHLAQLACLGRRGCMCEGRGTCITTDIAACQRTIDAGAPRCACVIPTSSERTGCRGIEPCIVAARLAHGRGGGTKTFAHTRHGASRSCLDPKPDGQRAGRSDASSQLVPALPVCFCDAPAAQCFAWHLAIACDNTALAAREARCAGSHADAAQARSTYTSESWEWPRKVAPFPV